MRRSDEVDDSPRAHGFLNEGTAEDDCALFDTNRRFLKVFNDIQDFLRRNEDGSACWDAETLAEKNDIDAELARLENELQAGCYSQRDGYDDAAARLRLISGLWRKMCIESQMRLISAKPDNSRNDLVGREVGQSRKPQRRTVSFLAVEDGNDHQFPAPPTFTVQGSSDPRISCLKGVHNFPDSQRRAPEKENFEGQFVLQRSTRFQARREPDELTSAQATMSYLKQITSRLEQTLTRLVGEQLARHQTRIDTFRAKAVQQGQMWGSLQMPAIAAPAFHMGTVLGYGSALAASDVAADEVRLTASRRQQLTAQPATTFYSVSTRISDILRNATSNLPFQRGNDQHVGVDGGALVAVSQGRVKGGAKWSHHEERHVNHRAGRETRTEDVSSYVPTSSISHDRQVERQRGSSNPHKKGVEPPSTTSDSLTTKKPTPDSTDTSSFRISERIINEGPFGSPGELPTTHGGILDPANMPPQKSELLPSLSLACSESRSPNKRKQRARKHQKCHKSEKSGQTRTSSHGRSNDRKTVPKLQALGPSTKKTAATSPSLPGGPVLHDASANEDVPSEFPTVPAGNQYGKAHKRTLKAGSDDPVKFV